MHDPAPVSPRERIRRAAIALVAERGYPGASLDLLLRRAEIDRAVFERNFEDLETCLIEVWVDAVEEGRQQLFESFDAADGWRDGIRAQAWTLCRFLQADHDRARLLMVATASAPEMIRAARDRGFRLFAHLVHRGTTVRPEAADVPFAQAEAATGAIWDRASKEVGAGAFDQLPKQVPDLMFTVVLPYLGLTAAKEELRRGDDDIARYERGEL